MWSTGRGFVTRTAGLGASVLVAYLVGGCGNSQSPTEAARLAESRRLEAEQAKTPNVVDALFLGSGPLIPRDGAMECPQQGVWSGYPRGATVRLRVSNRVSGSAQAALAGAVAPLTGATGGALTVMLDSAPDDLQPGVNEVTYTETATPRAAGCPSDAGCVQYRFAGRGLLMGVRVVGPRGQSAAAAVHDVVGHGVLGLCHIDARQIGGAENSLMSGGPGVAPGDGAPGLTSLDLEAIRLVYSSTVNPGATRSTFLAARLVNLQAGQLPRSQ